MVPFLPAEYPEIPGASKTPGYPDAYYISGFPGSSELSAPFQEHVCAHTGIAGAVGNGYRSCSLPLGGLKLMISFSTK
ncbi:hypothetical protein V6N13_092317 [Hibiscus sabdariffa]